jgi:hypothetical protein
LSMKSANFEQKLGLLRPNSRASATSYLAHDMHSTTKAITATFRPPTVHLLAKTHRSSE